MAITVTNSAALGPFLGQMRRAAQSPVVGASALNAEVLCIGDSMSSSVLDRRMGAKHRSLAWFHQFIRRLKLAAGDAGTTWPAAHTDEVYGGGRYVAGVGGGVALVREHGESPWAAYLASTMGYRPANSLMTVGVGMGNLYARCYAGYPFRSEPCRIPFRFLDVVYSRATTGIGEFEITIDGGTPTTFTGTADPADYNNLQTIDASALGVHDLILDANLAVGKQYGRYEALRFRTGLPGVLDRSVAVSGLSFGTLNATYTTDALRNVFMGNTGLGTPDLAVIMLGYNDGALASWNAGSQTTIKESTVAYADLLIAAGCPVLWVIPPANDGATTRRTEWDAIKTYVLANVADATTLCVVDCHDGITGWATGAAAQVSGYIYGENMYRRWSVSRQVQLGDIVVPLAAGPDGTNVYECTTAGTTHSAEPTWDTDNEAVTADNTVNWTTRRSGAITVSDATHPSPRGHMVLAEAILDGLGWDDLPWQMRRVSSGMRIGL